MLTKFKFNSNSGFTLAEIMIAAGILGVISLGVGKIFQSTSRTSRKMEEVSSVVAFSNQLRKVISYADACGSTFSGIDPSGSGQAVPAIFDKAGGTFIASGCPDAVCRYAIGTSGELQIESMNLGHYEDPLAPYNNGSEFSTLSVVVKKKAAINKDLSTLSQAEKANLKNRSFGALTETLRFPIRVRLDTATGQVVDCVDDLTLYKEGACASFGDPPNGTGLYDDSDSLCKSLVVKHTSKGATMPVGSELNALTVDGDLLVTGNTALVGLLEVDELATFNRGLRINDGQTSGLDLQIGDNAYLSDVDEINTLAIKGINNNATGNLRLGSTVTVTGASDGKMGVNQNAPQATLDVNGDIHWGDPGSRGVLSNDEGASLTLGGSGNPYIRFVNDTASTSDASIVLTGNDLVELTGANLKINSPYTVLINGSPVATENWVTQKFLTDLGTSATDSIIDHLISGDTAGVGSGLEVLEFKKNVCESIKFAHWTGTSCVLFYNRTCPDSSYRITGFDAAGDIICTPDSTSDTCPPGQYVTGVSTNGFVICGQPMLHTGVHSEADCYSLGGYIALLSGIKVCAFEEQVTCPSGWSTSTMFKVHNFEGIGGNTAPGDENPGCCSPRECTAPGTPGTWYSSSTAPTCQYYSHAGRDDGDNDDFGYDGHDNHCGRGDACEPVSTFTATPSTPTCY